MRIKKRLVLFTSLLLALTPLVSQDTHVKKRLQKLDFRNSRQQSIVHNFDVLHYDFHWTIDTTIQGIDGIAKISAKSLANPLNQLTLNLASAMTVAQIRQGSTVLGFTHTDDILTIFLLPMPGLHQEFEIEITYSGIPQSGLNFSAHNGQPIFWSLNEPSEAREWFPCFDHPSDKATAVIKITADQNMTVTSNGTLNQSQVNSDGTTTVTWREEFPIATYLISIAGTNYAVFSDTYTSGQRSMDVMYSVYPEDLTRAQEDFSVTVPMLTFYSQLFGEYPFFAEKYGMTAIPGNTAMEHQTNTSYPAGAITGNHQYDWLIAHELAHQWWGDLVTLADWDDIWLNEGFATYSDALWFEFLSGSQGLQDRMQSFKDIYLNHGGQEHSIYSPPPNHLFCEIIYEKSAWVLHMLRHVVGDADFWAILRQYANDYAYANATTQDFIDVCEWIYGEDLDWFFDQWIYEMGYPEYQLGWGYKDGTVLVLVNQTQENFPLFEMPVDLKLDLPSGPIHKTVWVDNKFNVYTFPLPSRPVAVSLDPDGWILCQKDIFRKTITSRR